MEKEGTLNFFTKVFEKVHRLAKLHLLVCPDSSVHYDESVVSTDFKKLKRLYELLSHGVSFWRPDQIRNAQLHNRALQYSGAPADSMIELSRERVVNGDLNAWRDWFQIALNSRPIDGLVDELREEKSKKQAGFAGVWKMWQQDTGRTFNDWYRDERMALSKVLKDKLSKILRRHIEIRFGRREMNMEDILPDDNETLVFDLKKALCGEDSNPALFKRVWEFLESEALDEVPDVRISSLVYAALARRANSGQKCPKKHPFNDVDVIAAYLPYCDAMFLDKEMESLLGENAVRTRLGYPTRIFSLRNKTQFLAYLDSIEANAPPGHIDLVREVYGNSWEKPYMEVFHEHSKS